MRERSTYRYVTDFDELFSLTRACSAPWEIIPLCYGFDAPLRMNLHLSDTFLFNKLRAAFFPFSFSKNSYPCIDFYLLCAVMKKKFVLKLSEPFIQSYSAYGCNIYKKDSCVYLVTEEGSVFGVDFQSYRAVGIISRLEGNPFAVIVNFLWYILICSCAVFLHSAFLMRRGKVFLFPGKSGIGKTTIVRFLSDSGFQSFTDDLCYLYRFRRTIFAENIRLHPHKDIRDYKISFFKKTDVVGEVNHIIFPERHNGRKNTCLIPLSPMETVKRLIPLSDLGCYKNKSIEQYKMNILKEVTHQSSSYSLKCAKGLGIFESQLKNIIMNNEQFNR